MKTTFNNFSKAVLIEFIMRQGYLSRFSAEELLRELRYIEWEIKSKDGFEAMDKAGHAIEKEDCRTPESMARWVEASKALDRAIKQLDDADKLYNKLNAQACR